MPEATRVAGYNAWKSKFKRQVKKGEKGIKIFAPCPFKKTETDKNGDEVEHIIPYYKVTYVFDISQTEGEPLPSLRVDNLEGTVANYSALLGAIIDAAPVPVKFDNINGSANGYYAPKNSEIVVQDSMSEIQTIKTAVHETAHAILHNPKKAEENGKKDSHTREVEAESVAFIVCDHFGLDTSDYSFPYIASWSSGWELKELRGSMEVIRETAFKIIDSINTCLYAFK